MRGCCDPCCRLGGERDCRQGCSCGTAVVAADHHRHPVHARRERGHDPAHSSPQKVTENTGQTIVVESRAGGGGAIGAAAVKQAPRTDTCCSRPMPEPMPPTRRLYPTLSYDPIRDFRPITLMWSFPQLLSVPLDSPAQSVAESRRPRQVEARRVEFASQGSGSGGHLLGEMLKARTGANMVHIPYRGAGPAALDLATGRVDFFFVSYRRWLSFLQAGKVRVLAAPRRNVCRHCRVLPR